MVDFTIIVYNGYITNIIQFFIMLIDFTEFELETISAAMEDYINYDDELLDEDELIGGLSVANRVESIQDKIYKVLVKSTNNGGKIIMSSLHHENIWKIV